MHSENEPRNENDPPPQQTEADKTEAEGNSAAEVPVPPELAPLTDNTHGDLDDPAIQAGLERMKQTVADEKEGLKHLGHRIKEAKEAEDHLHHE